MEKSKLFLLIGIFWLVILIGFVAIKEYTLRTGTEVLLKTIPVDPRDLFRGDYVVLRYEISTLDLDALPSDYADFETGNKIYVGLDILGGYGSASGIYRNTPKGKLYLKGIVMYAENNKVHIEYGIESYFVPEGEGKRVERLQRGQNLDVKVSIDKSGNAVIKNLLIDSKEVDFRFSE